MFHHEHSATFLSSQLIPNHRLPQPIPTIRLAEKCEPTMTSVIMTYLTIAGMLALTTFPVLVVALITAGHAVRRRIAGSARAANYLPTVSRRLAAAAA